MSEHDEQKTFFEWVRLNRQYADDEIKEALELCYSVPNGAHMSKRQAAKMKDEGMEKGILDINLDYPVEYGEYPFDTAFWHGLRIEMKIVYANGKKNYLSKEQKRKEELLEAVGYIVRVCYSAQEAIQAVVDYLPFDRNGYQGLKEFGIK